MATIQNVIDASIARYQDPDKTLWTDAELLAYGNKAVAYINQLLVQRNDHLGLKAATITTAEGTENYDLPSDFLAMYPGAKLQESGMWIDDNFLFPVRETERVGYDLTSDGYDEPLYYYMTATQFGLLPIPDGIYTVNYRYFYTITALALYPSASTMPWGGVFDEAISTFITSLANARGEMDVSMMTQLYDELEQSALKVLNVRTPIRPRMRLRKS